MRAFFSLSVAAALIVGSHGRVMAQLPSYLTHLPASPPTSPAVTTSERDVYLQPEMVEQMPRLGDRFTVVGPATKDYNAYAFAIGVMDRWLVPEAGTSDNPYAGVDKFFAQANYRRLATFDAAPRAGKQKVAVYATLKPDGNIDKMTAAAVQNPDGSWSCKCGGLSPIRFENLEQLRGAAYGLPLAIYERAVPNGAPSALVRPPTPAGDFVRR